MQRRKNGLCWRKFSMIRWKRRPTSSNLASPRLSPKRSAIKRTSLQIRTKNSKLSKLSSFSLFCRILNLKNVKIISADEKGIRIYPPEVRLIVTTSDIVLPISDRLSDMNYLKILLKPNVLLKNKSFNK